MTDPTEKTAYVLTKLIQGLDRTETSLKTVAEHGWRNYEAQLQRQAARINPGESKTETLHAQWGNHLGFDLQFTLYQDATISELDIFARGPLAECPYGLPTVWAAKRIAKETHPRMQFHDLKYRGSGEPYTHNHFAFVFVKPDDVPERVQELSVARSRLEKILRAEADRLYTLSGGEERTFGSSFEGLRTLAKLGHQLVPYGTEVVRYGQEIATKLQEAEDSMELAYLDQRPGWAGAGVETNLAYRADILAKELDCIVAEAPQFSPPLDARTQFVLLSTIVGTCFPELAQPYRNILAQKELQRESEVLLGVANAAIRKNTEDKK